jgi:choline kinase
VAANKARSTRKKAVNALASYPTRWGFSSPRQEGLGEVSYSGPPVSGLHAVILAAGKGSRLGEVGESTPKWLLRVGERTIAERQLEGLRQAGSAVASIRVVTGHAPEAVDDFLASQDGVQTVFNPEFERLNNWYSVLLALRSIDDSDATVAVFNSDLYAPAEWFRRFAVDAAKADAEALIAVDLERPLTDESMKVAVDGEEGSRLRAIGKVGVEDPVGEYVGMLAARGTMLSAFRAALEGFEGDPESVDEWYERAVGLNARAGGDWTVWPSPGSEWMEIDDDADYLAAAQLRGTG